MPKHKRRDVSLHFRTASTKIYHVIPTLALTPTSGRTWARRRAVVVARDSRAGILWVIGIAADRRRRPSEAAAGAAGSAAEAVSATGAAALHACMCLRYLSVLKTTEARAA